MILFSNKEFVETGDGVVNRLEGLVGLNVYQMITLMRQPHLNGSGTN